jgi:hypothetical protein
MKASISAGLLLASRAISSALRPEWSITEV